MNENYLSMQEFNEAVKACDRLLKMYGDNMDFLLNTQDTPTTKARRDVFNEMYEVLIPYHTVKMQRKIQKGEFL